MTEPADRPAAPSRDDMIRDLLVQIDGGSAVLGIHTRNALASAASLQTALRSGSPMETADCDLLRTSLDEAGGVRDTLRQTAQQLGELGAYRADDIKTINRALETNERDLRTQTVVSQRSCLYRYGR